MRFPEVPGLGQVSRVGLGTWQLELNVAAADLDLDTESQAVLTQAAKAFTPISAARTLLDALKTRSRS